jgi:hypothetical protein
VRWAELGQKAGQTGHYGGLHEEKSEKKGKVNGRTAKDTGPKLVWAALRNRKGLQILISRE